MNAIGYSYDAETLAWEGDRITLSSAPPEIRNLAEGIARYLEDALPADVELHEGCHSAEECDVAYRAGELERRVSDLEDTLKLVDANLGVDVGPGELENGEKIDTAKVVAERLKAEREEGVKDALVPSRSSAAVKARRLLLEGRVAIIRRDHAGELTGLVHAKIRGDSGKVYDAGYDPRGNGSWRCTCEEMRGQCSHLAALKLIVTVP